MHRRHLEVAPLISHTPLRICEMISDFTIQLSTELLTIVMASNLCTAVACVQCFCSTVLNFQSSHFLVVLGGSLSVGGIPVNA